MTSFLTYLEAKRSVDDRALNDRVFRAFADALAALAERRDGRVRILEVGGGVGTMIDRLVDRDALPAAVRYRLIDLDGEAVDRARERLPARLRDGGYTVEATPDGFLARPEGDRDDPTTGVGTGAGTETTLEVILSTGDAFADRDDPGPVDAVIGSAVFDLVDRDRALSWANAALESDGILYAPLTFDGSTGFAPPDAADERIERCYHRHMDDVREAPGGSRAGRRLVGALEDGAAPFEVIAVGGSNWILRPHARTGADAADDRVVLEHLLETVANALADYPAEALDPGVRRRWVARRRDELERGDLSGFVHHLDVLARVRE